MDINSVQMISSKLFFPDIEECALMIDILDKFPSVNVVVDQRGKFQMSSEKKS